MAKTLRAIRIGPAKPPQKVKPMKPAAKSAPMKKGGASRGR